MIEAITNRREGLTNIQEVPRQPKPGMSTRYQLSAAMGKAKSESLPVHMFPDREILVDDKEVFFTQKSGMVFSFSLPFYRTKAKIPRPYCEICRVCAVG